MENLSGASNLTKAGCCLAIIAFVLQLIGFATPYWLYTSSRGISTNTGLWQSCSSITGCNRITLSSCGDLGDKSSFCTQFKAAQAMATLAFIVLLVAAVSVALHLSVMRSNGALKKFGALSSLVGGVLALIGVILYATLDGIKAEYFHFSFAFCIIAAVGAVIASVLLMMK